MTLRPGWLADDEAWRNQLAAMDADEASWLQQHWEMAGGTEPAVDTSWVKTETVGDSVLVPLLTLVVAGVLIFAPVLIFVGGGH